MADPGLLAGLEAVQELTPKPWKHTTMTLVHILKAGQTSAHYTGKTSLRTVTFMIFPFLTLVPVMPESDQSDIPALPAPPKHLAMQALPALSTLSLLSTLPAPPLLLVVPAPPKLPAPPWPSAGTPDMPEPHWSIPPAQPGLQARQGLTGLSLWFRPGLLPGLQNCLSLPGSIKDFLDCHYGPVLASPSTGLARIVFLVVFTDLIQPCSNTPVFLSRAPEELVQLYLDLQEPYWPTLIYNKIDGVNFYFTAT